MKRMAALLLMPEPTAQLVDDSKESMGSVAKIRWRCEGVSSPNDLLYDELNEDLAASFCHHSRLLLRSCGLLVLTLMRGNFPGTKYTLIFTTHVGLSWGPSLILSVSAEGAKSSVKWTCLL